MRRVSAVWGRTLVEHVVLEDVLADLGGDGGAPVAGADECDLLGHAWLLSVFRRVELIVPNLGEDRTVTRRRRPAVCDGWPTQALGPPFSRAVPQRPDPPPAVGATAMNGAWMIPAPRPTGV